VIAPVSVAQPGTGGLAPRLDRRGLQRLAGGDRGAQPLERREVGAPQHHAVLRRRHAEDVDAEVADEVGALLRVEARVVQDGGRAAQPSGDERVARRLRPARGGRAPHAVAGARVEPVLGLQPLAGEVAGAVDDGLRLARRAAGEDQQGRVVGRDVDAWRERLAGERRVGQQQGGAVEPGAGDLAGVLLGGQHDGGPDEPCAQREVAAAALRHARQRDGAEPERRHQGRDPLRPVAHDGHHDRSAADAERGQPRGQAGRRVLDLAEGDRAPLALAGDRQQRRSGRVVTAEDLGGEVHTGWIAET